jgi:hypothetical protein
VPINRQFFIAVVSATLLPVSVIDPFPPAAVRKIQLSKTAFIAKDDGPVITQFTGAA